MMSRVDFYTLSGRVVGGEPVFAYDYKDLRDETSETYLARARVYDAFYVHRGKMVIPHVNIHIYPFMTDDEEKGEEARREELCIGVDSGMCFRRPASSPDWEHKLYGQLKIEL